MFSVWEHRKKLCWIWDRINAHNIIAIFLLDGAAGEEHNFRTCVRGQSYNTLMLSLGIAADNQQKTLHTLCEISR
jgi:hypothetical protein